MYGESPAGPLTTDFRRGSVGNVPNRENTAARDFSDGFYFRRARFGVEGTIARDFNYRLLLELGGSGTEGPTRINDAWIAYNGFAPFSFQLGAFSPPANMDDGTSPEDLPFLERATASELSRSLGGADGRIGLGVKASGARWMSALTFTTRTVNDAEVFDTQFAAVGRAAFLAATSDDYNLHLGASGTYVFSTADQGLGTTPQHPLRFRDRPEIRVDSVRLVDTGSIDAEHASSYGLRVRRQLEELLSTGRALLVRRRARRADRAAGSGLRRVLPAGQLDLHGRTSPVQPGHGFIPESAAHGAFLEHGRLRRLRTRGALQPHEPQLHGRPRRNRGHAQRRARRRPVVTTLGLNWFPNPNIKVMLNYLMIDVDRLNPAGPGNTTPFGAAPNTPPIGVEIGQDLDVFALRTQFSF
jgi:phosphate-selective porin OprO/OprP